MRKFKKNASWHFDWFLFPFWTGPLRGSLEIETEPTGFHVVAASMLALVFGSRTRKPQQFGPCLTSFLDSQWILYFAYQSQFGGDRVKIMLNTIAGKPLSRYQIKRIIRYERKVCLDCRPSGDTRSTHFHHREFIYPYKECIQCRQRGNLV